MYSEKGWLVCMHECKPACMRVHMVCVHLCVCVCKREFCIDPVWICDTRRPGIDDRCLSQFVFSFWNRMTHLNDAHHLPTLASPVSASQHGDCKYALLWIFVLTRMDPTLDVHTPASRSLLTEPSPHFCYVTIKSPAASFLNVYFYHIMRLHVLKNIKIYLTTFKFYFKAISQISITFQCPGRHKIIIRIFQSEYKDS